MHEIPVHETPPPFLLGTALAIPGISGCSALSAEPGSLDLVLVNQTDDPYTVEMSVFRDDESNRTDAREFSGRIDVPPDGRTEREGVAETVPSVIAYDVYRDNSRLTDQGHVHYYPIDDGESDSQAFDIRSPGVLTQRQR